MTESLFPEDDEARARAAREREEAEAAERLRWAQHDADFTPPDAARLGAWAVRRYLVPLVASLPEQRSLPGLWPRRILGPCAGAGTWLAAAREFFPEAELRALDIREEERPHLEHHVGRDNVEIADFTKWRPVKGEAPDLILDNLPFKYALDFLQAGVEVLADGGLAVWFCRLTLGDAEDVKAWLADHPYCARLEFVDRLKFRVGINPSTGKPWGVDNVGYKLIAFHKVYRPDTYLGKRLPSLPTESRRWRKTRDGRDIRPGTEYLHPDAEPSLWTPPALNAGERATSNQTS